MARVDASDLLRDMSSSSQPFDIPLTDISSVQKEFNLGRNGSVGVIYIQTNCNGFLEVIPHTEDGRDSVVAFLQACLPQGTLKDKLSILELRQLHLSRSDSSLFDMEQFEFHAVKKRFANESIWERMRRRSARFSARIQECESTLFLNLSRFEISFWCCELVLLFSLTSFLVLCYFCECSVCLLRNCGRK